MGEGENHKDFIVTCNYCGRKHSLRHGDYGATSPDKIEFGHCASGPFWFKCPCGNEYDSHDK